MRLIRSASLIAVCGALIAAEGLAPETEVIDNKQISVSPKKELTFNVPADVTVATRELWYRSFDGKAWGAWQKHSITFAKDTPITWAPPEGHWQVYLRKILTSGLAPEVPGEATKPSGEFIIDRTAPAVAIGFPASKAKLRGGDRYTVKWDAQDSHLRTSPVNILWSVDGKGTFAPVATGIANNGSFEWNVPKDMTTAGVLKIEAADKATNVGSAEVTAILVDSIKPKGKVVGPAIVASQTVKLDLDIKDEGPAGLASAQLWISQDDGVSWTQGPFIQDPRSVEWKAPSDGKFRLAIVASDASGNTSPIPKGKADDQFVITVDTAAPVILLTSAIGIIPGDKPAPTPQRAFKPGDNVQVQFAIKDINLAPNTVSVFFQADASKPWQELAVGQSSDTAYRFALSAVPTTAARIRVTAIDQAGNTGEAIAGETFEIQTAVQDDKVEINLAP